MSEEDTEMRARRRECRNSTFYLLYRLHVWPQREHFQPTFVFLI